MKTQLILLLAFFSFLNGTCQTNSCQQKFLNCKEMVINGFKNNDTSFTSRLSNGLAQMQLCDPSLGTKFTSWYSNFIENYKSEMDNELAQLQREKQAVQQTADQVRAQSLNNTTQYSQQMMQQTQSVKAKSTNSEPYRCDECPKGTVR